jgi:PKD repeat protein
MDLSSDSVNRWYWYFGDGGYSTLQNPTHIYKNRGKYTVYLYAYNTVGYNLAMKLQYINIT